MVKRYSEKCLGKHVSNTTKEDLGNQFKRENDFKPLSATSSISSTDTTLIKPNGSTNLNSFLSPRIPFADILNKRYPNINGCNDNASPYAKQRNLSLLQNSSDKNVQSNKLYFSSPHKQHTSSEPAIMPSQEYYTDENEQTTYKPEISSPTDQKRRRLQCHSLDDIDPRICTPPSPYKTPREIQTRRKSPKTRLASVWPMSPSALNTPTTPLSPMVLNSLWSNAPVQSNNEANALSPRSMSFSYPESSDADINSRFENAISNISLPIRAVNLNASRQMSCPVQSKSPKVDVPNTSNYSLDSSR